MSCEGGNQLVLKTGPSKPELENLTLCQWSTANLAILHKLVGEVVSGEGIMDVVHHPCVSTICYKRITICVCV